MLKEGQIQVIYGPMFSGKSSELLRKVRRYEHARKSCLVINYLHDNRYSSDEVMSTHDRQVMKALKTANLEDVRERALTYDVVAIDEGQFYPNIVQFCQDLANRGIMVLVAALDGTFQRKAFGNIHNLLPVAEKVTKLTAVCVKCSKEAAFTMRVIESQQIELIGGEESYQPVCRKCFHMAKKTANEKNLCQTTEKTTQKNENPELKSNGLEVTVSQF